MDNPSSKTKKAIDDFDKRYRTKKIVNIICNLLIICMGVFSVIFIFQYDKDGVLTFRWLTVDGTMFTILLTILILPGNIYELITRAELSGRVLYLLRLTSAVTEGIIIIVVLISQLPFFSAHMHIARIDMFFMHICIPIITIFSFINDMPARKKSILDVSLSTSFIIIYLIIIIVMIETDVLTEEYIPYSFLNSNSMGGIFVTIGLVIVSYIGSCVLAYYMAVWNRKAYWLWFKNVA